MASFINKIIPAAKVMNLTESDYVTERMKMDQKLADAGMKS